MTFRTYITVKGEVKIYPEYSYKKSKAKNNRVKCPICGSWCLTIFHKKFSNTIVLGYICHAHTPPHIFIDGKYKIFDAKVITFSPHEQPHKKKLVKSSNI